MATNAGTSTGNQSEMTRNTLVFALTVAAGALLLCGAQWNNPVSAFATNMAERYHAHALMQIGQRLSPGMVVPSGVLSEQTDVVHKALAWSEIAVNAKQNWTTQLAQARIRIETESKSPLHIDSSTLTPLALRPFDVPIVLRSLIDQKQFQRVIDSMAPLLDTQITAEERSLVELALLHIAQSKLSSSDTPDTERLSTIRQILASFPQNLWANSYLLDALPPASPEKETILHNLRTYSASSLTPMQPESVAFVARAVLALRRNGVWTEAETYNALSTLVWRYPTDSVLEHVLNQLRLEYPENSAYPSLLGELMLRRSELHLALPYYRAAAVQGDLLSMQRVAAACALNQTDCIAIDQAITEKFSETLVERWESVEQFCNWQFDTIMLCRPASTSDDAVLDALSGQLSNEPLTWADGSKTPGREGEKYLLGANLIPNPNFEQWTMDGYPSQWWLQDMSYAGGKGAFVSGKEMHPLAQSSQSAARITGFWVDENYASHGLMLGNNGIESPVLLQPGKTYLLSMRYSTDQTSEQAVRMWTSSYFPFCNESPTQPLPPEVVLPSTGQLMVRVDLLLCTPDNGEIFELPYALRLWSPGSLIVDHIMIREIVSG